MRRSLRLAVALLVIAGCQGPVGPERVGVQRENIVNDAGVDVPKILISEFRFRGPPSTEGGSGAYDEFIELYNPNPVGVDISGWQLWGSNGSSPPSVSSRVTIDAGTTMPPYGFFLLALSSTSGSYSGTVSPDQTYGTGITDTGGVALRMPDGTFSDQVGCSTNSAYQEGTPLPAFTSTNKDQSYERKPGPCGGPATDTDDNSADFVYNDGVSHPQNSSSSVCASPPEPTACYDVPGTCDGAICTYAQNAGSCDDGNPCTSDDKCASGTCAGTPNASNTCDDGDPCSQNDHCTDTGACASDPVVCDTPPQCHTLPGTCSAGTCSYAVDATLICSDGSNCTADDHCDDAGQCVGTECVTPPAAVCQSGDTESVWYDAAGTCTSDACDYVQHVETCAFGCDTGTGRCIGDPCAGVTCDTPRNECYETTGTCDGSTGTAVCTYPLKDPLPSCDDGDACTSGDTCDGNGDCVGDVCVEPPGDQCWLSPGTCNTTGTPICEYTPRAENDPCDDGDLCTDNDVCSAAQACAGTPKVCAPAAPTCLSAADIETHEDPRCVAADGSCTDDAITVTCRAGCDQTNDRCATAVVIAEFRTRGPAAGNDEFVELFNTSDSPVDVSGWKLSYLSDGGTTPATRATLPAGTIMPPRTYYLLTNSGGYSGAVAGDQTYGSGIADSASIALLDASGDVVDGVAMNATSAYLETKALAPLAGDIDHAYQRRQRVCGEDQDTDDNAADFVYTTTPDPQNSQSCRLACAGDPCVPRAAECSDASTQVTYAAACTDGACVYTPTSTTCDFGCDAGACKPDPCAGVTCDTPTNAECQEAAGTCSDGTCSYPSRPDTTTCDDGDACTENDHCDGAGGCTGTAKTCTPPDPVCKDASTSTVYSGGTCVSGTCSFLETDTPCSAGCDSTTGECNDPCAGVTCDTPPDTCHEATGTCADGECSYAARAAGADCDDGNACTVGDKCNASLVCVPGQLSSTCRPDAGPGDDDDGGGCGCVAARRTSSRAPAAWLLLAGLALLARGRRRRR